MKARLWLLGAAGLAAGLGAYWVASHAGCDVPQIPSAPLAVTSTSAEGTSARSKRDLSRPDGERELSRS